MDNKKFKLLLFFIFIQANILIARKPLRDEPDAKELNAMDVLIQHVLNNKETDTSEPLNEEVKAACNSLKNSRISLLQIMDIADKLNYSSIDDIKAATINRLKENRIENRIKKRNSSKIWREKIHADPKKYEKLSARSKKATDKSISSKSKANKRTLLNIYDNKLISRWSNHNEWIWLNANDNEWI
jgi:hypothetical protein